MKVRRIFFCLGGIWYEAPRQFVKKYRRYSTAYFKDEEGEIPDLALAPFVIYEGGELEGVDFLSEDKEAEFNRTFSEDNFILSTEKLYLFALMQNYLVEDEMTDTVSKYREIYDGEILTPEEFATLYEKYFVED